jgi:membrane protein
MPSMLKHSLRHFQRHKAQWLAAAIAYYLTFAIAPLIIVVVAIAGLVLGHHRAVLDEIYAYIGAAAGQASATAIQSIVHTAFTQMQSGALAKTIGWVIFLVATIGLFTVLQDALNIVWDVTPTKQTLADFLRSRAVAVASIVAIALLLTVSLTANSALTIAGNALASASPSLPFLMKSLDFSISFLVVAGLLCLIYKFLPACRVEWRDVWLGSVLTSLLFVIGQFLLGWYLGRAAASSPFGAFTSLIVFLLWTNYSAQILLFGAEFTQVFAQAHGSRRRAQHHS